MANPSPATVLAPIGQALKVMPGHVAVNVSSFLELAPGLRDTPTNHAKLQKILKDGRPGRREGGAVHKGYCKKVGRVLFETI